MNKNLYLVLGGFGVVVLGVLGAWLISTKLMNKNVSNAGVAPGAKVTSTSAGILDPKVKYDTATGNLLDGGIGNEGTHHMDRDGISAHYVYLTSSVVDLSAFVGKKVEVWGQTLASKKAGWLMDVSKIEVVQ